MTAIEECKVPEEEASPTKFERHKRNLAIKYQSSDDQPEDAYGKKS